MEPVCKIRIPPATDKATAARTEAKALMRGLLEEMGVPALVAKVEAQEAELRRIREANNHLFERLQSNVRGWGSQSDNAMRLDQVLEALLEYLTVMHEGGGEETWPQPIPDIDLGPSRRLTEAQEEEFVRYLTRPPSLLDSFSSVPLESPQTTRRIGFGSSILRESDVAVAGSEQPDTGGGPLSRVRLVPSPFVSSPSEGDDEEEDPIGDLEM